MNNDNVIVAVTTCFQTFDQYYFVKDFNVLVSHKNKCLNSDDDYVEKCYDACKQL